METTLDSGLVVEHRSTWDSIPNGNDPASVPPATVGADVARPGDPNGVEFVPTVTSGGSGRRPPRAMPWAGWPADWDTPNWWGRVETLTDTAWGCLDLNASILASMPPYLVGAATSLSADWLNNPDPIHYASWPEFTKSLFWDFMLGEAFVLATAYYSTGYPARFHVVPPWLVNVEFARGVRRYDIGGIDVTSNILHIRYSGNVTDAHGHGPLEAGRARLVAANALSRYASTVAASGGIPNSVLVHPGNLDNTQAQDLQMAWVEARMSSMGLPAVLSGGIDFKTLQFSPKDMALLELAQFNEARIAVLLGVPPFLMGLPSGGDSMTYSNVVSLFDYHWRAGLRTKVAPVMAALSNWALPRGSAVELNRDEYVRPGPLERAQTWQILIGLGVLTVEQVQEIERYIVTAPSATLSSGVLQ